MQENNSSSPSTSQKSLLYRMLVAPTNHEILTARGTKNDAKLVVRIALDPDHRKWLSAAVDLAACHQIRGRKFNLMAVYGGAPSGEIASDILCLYILLHKLGHVDMITDKGYVHIREDLINDTDRAKADKVPESMFLNESDMADMEKHYEHISPLVGALMVLDRTPASEVGPTKAESGRVGDRMR